MGEDASFDNQVRLSVYRFFLEQGRPPVPAEIAAVGRPAGAVEAALHRLADAHVLVLAPGTPYIWMANPLSALPTPFQVHTDRQVWFGNCIWDALGVVAMLDGDADVRSWCPDCGHDLTLSVRDRSISGDGIVHFAVPAAHWWDDIGFT